MAEDTIRGYKVLGDRPKDRQLSMEYIQQTHREVSLHTPLTLAAGDKGASCLNRPEDFSVGSEDGGDDLPTDREAQMLCAPCPIMQQCREYAELKHPSYGVWGGKVYGRKLAAAMKEGDDEQ